MPARAQTTGQKATQEGCLQARDYFQYDDRGCFLDYGGEHHTFVTTRSIGLNHLAKKGRRGKR